MNKVIGIIVVILLIAAGAYFLLLNKDASETKTDTSSAQTEEEVQASSTSLKELIAAGRSQKCTFSSTEGSVSNSGTFYVANSKARGDFSTTANNKTQSGHMIMDGEFTYIWSDGANEGMKMKTPEANADTSTSTQASVDPNKNYKYDCDSWNAYSSMFSPPTTVKFNELTIPAMPAASSQTDASVCANLPEPAKTQCIASMQKSQ